MLYSEKIEALISAALADGVLTEKEKQVLFKKAEAEGIDLDEFEMVLDARLVASQKAEREKAEKSAPKSTKYGDVRKCPVCGAMVPALAGTCPECGYEFSGLDANLSSKKLAELITGIKNTYEVTINTAEKEEGRWEINKNKIDAIGQAIKTFPIPTTKADLFEFITTMQANMLSEESYRTEAAAYLTKYNEALIKAKAMFGADPIFSSFLADKNNVLSQYKKIHKKQKGYGMKPDAKNSLKMLGILLFLIGMIVITFMTGTSGRETTTPSKCLEKVEKAIEKGNYRKAEQYIVKFTGGKDSYDGKIYNIEDCHESVVALERALLKEDRYEEAEAIFEIYLDKIKESSNAKSYKEKAEGPLKRYKDKLKNP